MPLSATATSIQLGPIAQLASPSHLDLTLLS